MKFISLTMHPEILILPSEYFSIFNFHKGSPDSIVLTVNQKCFLPQKTVLCSSSSTKLYGSKHGYFATGGLKFFLVYSNCSNNYYSAPPPHKCVPSLDPFASLVGIQIKRKHFGYFGFSCNIFFK